jgi:hypothetical protein
MTPEMSACAPQLARLLNLRPGSSPLSRAIRPSLPMPRLAPVHSDREKLRTRAPSIGKMPAMSRTALTLHSERPLSPSSRIIPTERALGTSILPAPAPFPVSFPHASRARRAASSAPESPIRPMCVSPPLRRGRDLVHGKSISSNPAPQNIRRAHTTPRRCGARPLPRRPPCSRNGLWPPPSRAPHWHGARPTKYAG